MLACGAEGLEVASVLLLEAQVVPLRLQPPLVFMQRARLVDQQQQPLTQPPVLLLDVRRVLRQALQRLLVDTHGTSDIAITAETADFRRGRFRSRRKWPTI